MIVPMPAVSESLNLFTRMCLMSGGHLRAAEPLLASMPVEAGVRRLSNMEAARFHAGRRGGAAWALTSPNATRAALDFAPQGGPCSVRVQQVDCDALHSGLEALMQHLVRDGATRQRRTQDVRTPVDGGEERQATYILEGGSDTISATITLRTSTATTTPWQAILTFEASAPAGKAAA